MDLRPARVLEVRGDVNFGEVLQIKPTRLQGFKAHNKYVFTDLLVRRIIAENERLPDPLPKILRYLTVTCYAIRCLGS